MTLRQHLYITDNVVLQWLPEERKYVGAFTKDITIFVKPYSDNSYEYWLTLGSNSLERGFCLGKPQLKTKMLETVIQYNIQPIE